VKEIVGARKHIVDAVPAREDEQRGGHPVSRRHAAESEIPGERVRAATVTTKHP
jgi:hypothetical protein